jgi:hypothetical protein
MATATKKLGPACHGQPLTLEEFLAGRYKEGYHYELINGRLYVAPAADLPEDSVEKWLYAKVLLYSLAHPDVIVHRRYRGRWQVIEVGFGETYTTRLLPGFKLLLDIHK